MCTLITLGNAKPQVLSEVSGEIIPSLIIIFDGLKRAYEARAEAEEEEESDEDEEVDDCEEGISSDEDEMNELDNSYMERIAELARKKGTDQGLEISAIVKVSFFYIFQCMLFFLNIFDIRIMIRRMRTQMMMEMTMKVKKRHSKVIIFDLH